MTERSESPVPQTELIAAVEELFIHEPLWREDARNGFYILDASLMRRLEPGFPDAVDDLMLRGSVLPPPPQFGGFIVRQSLRMLDFLDKVQGKAPPHITVSHPFEFESQDVRGFLYEEWAWLDVRTQAYQGSIEVDGRPYVFTPAKKVLIASSHHMNEDGRHVTDGVEYSMVLGTESEPTVQAHGDVSRGVPVVDLQRHPTENMLQIIQAAARVK